MSLFNIKAKIYISDKNVLTYENEDIVSFSRGGRDSSNSNILSIGVVSRYGSLIVKDKNGYLLGLAQADVLDQDLIIEIYKANGLIGRYKTTKSWKYDYTKNQAEIELKSRVVEWSDTFFTGISYTENSTALSLLNALYSVSLKENDKIEDVFEPLSEDVQFYLQNIKLAKMYLKPSYLNVAWNKFCNFAMLQVYENDNGKIEIRRC